MKFEIAAVDAGGLLSRELTGSSMAGKSRKQKVEIVVPSAARTIRSLRDIGYDLPRAVADLIDNSIAAGATQVDVTLRFDGSGSWIRVADNGEGMDAATLLEAMRYGSERDYAADDLGKFGFGLKTASTSQCRRLTVASRRASQQRRFEVRCLDLAHVEATNRWEVLVLEGQDRPEHLLGPLQNGCGTVVLWEDLDRVLDYKDPFGSWAKRRMLNLAEEIDEHLAMVFHRFLAGEVKGQKLSIRVNGSKVIAWDPFCREERAATQLPAKDLQVTGSDGLGIVRVHPHVLPQQTEFSSDAAWRRASGPSKWNRQQGLYIYRANRLIQPGGGWNRIRTVDEHTKLARVAVDFYPELDASFGIDIAKAFVQLPDDLREHLEPIVTGVAREAERRYRKGGSRRGRAPTPTPASGARSGTGPSTMAGAEPSSREPEPPRRGPLPAAAGGRARRAMEEAADVVGEVDALAAIVRELVERNPEVASDLGW